MEDVKLMQDKVLKALCRYLPLFLSYREYPVWGRIYPSSEARANKEIFWLQKGIAFQYNVSEHKVQK